MKTRANPLVVSTESYNLIYWFYYGAPPGYAKLFIISVCSRLKSKTGSVLNEKVLDTSAWTDVLPYRCISQEYSRNPNSYLASGVPSKTAWMYPNENVYSF